MNTIINNIMNFFKNIGKWFVGLFDAIERGWNKLSSQIQRILVQSSKIIGILNKYVDETPEVIIQIITSNHPEITREKLKEYLTEASEHIAGASEIANKNLEELIKFITEYLKNRPDDDRWSEASSSLAKLLAIITAKDKKVALAFWVVEMFMSHAYQRFVKKKL